MKDCKTLGNKRLVMFILLNCLMFFGCKKSNWFDEKSDKSLAVPTTLTDLQALLDNARVMNTNTPGLGEVGSDGHSILDNSIFDFISKDGGEENCYTWSYLFPFIKSVDWSLGASGSYRRVYYCNLVIDELKKIKPKGQTEYGLWENVKGQALFHRAHAFYELAQVFAPPFESRSAGDKLGIPLRLESDINLPSKRNTLQQTYDQIIGDLLLANELLPETPVYRTRPSKQAVYALLARCYLSMEDYKEAIRYAELCLNSYNMLMNYNELNITGTSNPFIGFNTEIIFYSKMVHYESIAFYNLVIDKMLYDSYAEQDLRKKAFFNFDVVNNLVRYKGTYCGLGFAGCFSGLATDEIYLIRAECNARAGKVTEAMSDLNKLLKTRWLGPYKNLLATNAEEALVGVLEERKKQLVLRGLRWSDLRRLNRDPRFAVTLTRTLKDKTYTLEPASNRYTMPIPDEIIQKTGMEQNEGWK